MRCAASFFAVLLAASAHAAGDASLLPTTDAVSGWKPSGHVRVFTGSGLYGLIDGGAEIFFEFGFEEVTVQRYARGDEGVEVEVYRMADPGAALGIYLERCGTRCEPPGAYGNFPRYTTRGATQLMFVRSRYLVIVTADRAGVSADTSLAAFGAEVEKHLPPDHPFESEARLEPGWLPGSWRLIRGPLALQQLITLGEGDVLQLRGRLTAEAADYPAVGGRPACTLIVVEYPDDAGAGAALAHLRTGLDPEIKAVRETAGGFVFRDYAGKSGSVATVGHRMELRINLSVEPGPTP